jgi:hypothetical protein
LSCAEATDGVDSRACCGAVMDRNYATGGGLATARNGQPTFFLRHGQIELGKYY